MSRSLDTIFVVDDQQDIRMIATRALRLGRSWQVMGFADGEACLDALDTTTPDLILLDVMMPGLDGPTTLERLRDAGCEAPVILMTARAGRRREAEYRAAGAVGCIPKPFDPLSLVGQVEALLGVTAGEGAGGRTQVEDDGDEDLDLVFRRQLVTRMSELSRTLALAPVPDEFRTQARTIAHSLAGSAGSFGFHALGLVAGRLESLLAAELDEDGWSQVHQTRRELEQIVAHLQSED